MDHRLALIRCVLLCLVGVALFGWGWLWLGAASMGLGLMMPVFAVATDCPTICSAVNATWSVSFASIANAACGDCAMLNTGYTLNTNNTCGVTRTDSDICSGFGTSNPNGEAMLSGGQVKARTSLVIIQGLNHQATIFESGNLGAAPQDCTTLGTPSLSMTANNLISGSYRCDTSAATSSIVF